MDNDHDLSELAELLELLKRRAGLSYQRLGIRAHISRASAHRYCTGRAFPPDLGTVERLARACGADQAEFHRLIRVWTRLEAQRRTGAAISDPELESATDEPAPRPSRLFMTIAGVAVVALVASLAISLQASDSPKRLPDKPSITFWPPPWHQDPIPVTSPFFGVTINSSTGAMPTFEVGGVRFWDSRTRWANIQPTKDQWDWTILDRLVSSAQTKRLPVTFTFGGTPGWAAPTAQKTAYDDDSRTAPPDDLADWDTFVQAVTRRYRGRIDAYELWVAGNDTRYYSGTPESLVEMTRRASAIINATDSKAVVICPSMSQLWKPAGQAALLRFAELRGYDHCDGAGVKLHQRAAIHPPETMLQLTAEIDALFHRANAHPKLFSTGTIHEIALEKPLDPDLAADYAVRFFLTGLYSRYQRMYFYNWGGTKIPIVLQPEGGSPTKAALQVEELQRWLAGARIASCGQGTQAGLPDQVWQCRFVGENNRHFLIRWTASGEVRTSVDAEMRLLRRLDGSTQRLTHGMPMTIGPRPVAIDVSPDS